MRNCLMKFLRGLKEQIRPPRCQQSKSRLLRDNLDAYQRHHGYRMDINNPVTFTEKIQWYKLNYNGGGVLRRIVDKYWFKEYIKEKLGDGFTIPLYGYWNSVKELRKDWDSLPEEFCLKSTISSEGANIMIIHNKSSLCFKSLEKELKKWLKPKNTMLDSWCCGYYETKPGILAEKYMENINKQLFDFKVFCFDGIPHCVYAAVEHFDKSNYPIVFYNLNWQKLNVHYGNHLTTEVPRPKHLEQMVDIAKKLSAGFPFVRVDFFDTDETLLLAEMTFYPGGGLTPYYPSSFNEELG